MENDLRVAPSISHIGIRVTLQLGLIGTTEKRTSNIIFNGMTLRLGSSHNKHNFSMKTNASSTLVLSRSSNCCYLHQSQSKWTFHEWGGWGIMLITQPFIRTQRALFHDILGFRMLFKVLDIKNQRKYAFGLNFYEF